MAARVYKPALIAVLVALLLSLTGCEASVSQYSYSTDEYSVQTLEVRLPDTMRKQIEDSAAVISDTSDGKWKLAGWLRALSELVVFADGSKYEYKGVGTDGSDFVVTLERRVLLSDLPEEDDENVTRARKNYFWFYAYEVTQPNPFNELRAEYDAGTDNSVMGFVKKGVYREDGTQLLPSLTQAFPKIAEYDPSGLKLNLYLGFSDKISATGTWTMVDGRRYCLYERSFDNAQHTVTYKYLLPNSVGWNVTALAVAGIVVGVILLATRKEKPAGDKKQIKFNY